VEPNDTDCETRVFSAFVTAHPTFDIAEDSLSTRRTARRRGVTGDPRTDRERIGPLLFVPGEPSVMAAFDPEQFEDKYVHYFTELQRAYKNAFEVMRERYDSDLVHAIDQCVLDESEPFYEEGSFHVELPDDPATRMEGSGVPFDESTLEAALDDYTAEIETQLRRVFDVDRDGEPKA
jgi:hypothetical protein